MILPQIVYKKREMQNSASFIKDGDTLDGVLAQVDLHFNDSKKSLKT